jgi:Tol biopolymer transport system component
MGCVMKNRLPMPALGALLVAAAVAGCGGRSEAVASPTTALPGSPASSAAPGASAAAAGSQAAGAPGGLLLFSAQAGGNWDLYVVSPNGTGLRRLTSGETRESDPAWSPNGKQIAFVSDRDGGLDVYVMRSDGTQVRRITERAALNWSPAWSPDGARIAFTSNRDRKASTVYSAAADGSSAKPIAAGEGAAWSPDGTSIALAKSGQGKSPGFEIWVYDGSGKGSKLVARSSVNLMPAWSPDGSMVAFTFQDDHGFQVGLVRSNGEPVDRTFQGLAPVWSPDGHRLAAVDSGIAMVDLATGTAARVPLPEGFDVGRVSWAATPK